MTTNKKIIEKREPDIYDEDKIEELAEQFNCCNDRHKKRELKNQYNKLATELNEKFGRKVYKLL